MSYGPTAFLGTSASAPHVAGAFALLSGKTPYSLEQIYAILQNRAVDLGPAGKDNQFGYGRLNLKKKQ
jgi:subtilisin family serine protease